MKFSQSVVALVATASLSVAAPLAKRQATAITDADIVCLLRCFVTNESLSNVHLSSTML